MRSLIDDCMMVGAMRLKWEYMVEDAKAVLIKSFDTMFSDPGKVSRCLSRTVKVSGGREFTVYRITIGYATFVIAAQSTPGTILLDANLDDGQPMVDWQKLPEQFRGLFEVGPFDEKTMWL